MEVWRKIRGFHHYEISDMGVVFSHKTDKILVGGYDTNGYRIVCLWENGRQITKSVHRLVLENFVGTPPKGYEARHLNGDRLDNRLSNLKWGTHRDNILDSVRHGTHHLLRKGENSLTCGEKARTSKLTKVKVIEIRNLYLSGKFTQKHLAGKFGICQSQVSRIISMKDWAWV